MHENVCLFGAEIETKTPEQHILQMQMQIQWLKSSSVVKCAYRTNILFEENCCITLKPENKRAALRADEGKCVL